ncbi:MAG: malate dehydrogenase [Parcubacteria group bacterium]|nr:malate dehydrogenase [Parcubacteria group bacterium]
MNTPAQETYDVIVIGGGASGTALLYTLAKYTDIKRLALVEKYADAGLVNSNAKNNSQTLHVGDIETHYSYKKAAEVKPASMMVARYTERLPEEEKQKIIRKMQKMALAVGEEEVKALRDRLVHLKEIFPTIEGLEGKDIAKLEPEVMKGRDPKEPVFALYNPEGYAVNFGELSRSFIRATKERASERADILFNTEVTSITKNGEGYRLETNNGILEARAVVVDTDAYSLGFAKSLGYGKEFSLIPIAGTFYFGPEVLRGKVYRVQDPKMPFSAAHGDRDIDAGGKTRFGPTARFFPVLEARNYGSIGGYFRASGLGKWKTWKSFYDILLEPVRFKYLLKNVAYEFPYFGRFLFLPEVKKIIPTMSGFSLRRAKGYGGMRLQRVDTNTKELLLGEGKIIGHNIIFNMTPSPGASVCLFNAMRDACEIEKFFKNEFVFDKNRMQQDLGCENLETGTDVSLKANYPA